MVLRKQPPPNLENLSKWNGRPGSHSPSSPIPKSSASYPHGARIPRVPSQESVYSPDLNTSPAFDLMPLHDAQRSPVGSPASYPPHTKTESWGEQTEHHRSDTVKALDATEISLQGDGAPRVLTPPGSDGMAEHSWESTISGGSPVELQSNNPFLKSSLSQHGPDLSEPNEWKDRHSRTTTSRDSLTPSMYEFNLGI